MPFTDKPCRLMTGRDGQSDGRITDKRSRRPAPESAECPLTCGNVVGGTRIEPVTSSVSEELP